MKEDDDARLEMGANTNWIDGFRRAEPRPGYLPTDAPERFYDIRAANAKTANTALARELKGRHLQMIAFGGAIGKTPIHGTHS